MDFPKKEGGGRALKYNLNHDVRVLQYGRDTLWAD